ncbi:glycosyltransferase [Chamaesiphon sp.]|uniref:glycosyltransferase n=1 Tax=Chamaesiphon sp. TaxID=2814140 RepID=UPI0035948B90
MRRRVLFIAPRIPFPLMQGDRIVCHQRLQSLSTKYAITLVTFYQSQQELENTKLLLDFCEEIHTIYLPKWQSLLNCVMCLFDRHTPFQVAYYRSKQLQLKLDELTAQHDFDLAHYFLLRVADYQVPSNVVKIIDLIDSMQLNFSSRIAIEQNTVKKLILKTELNRVANYEIDVIDRFSKSILVSKKDADFIDKYSPKMEVIPVVINTSIFKPSVIDRDHSSVKIIFSGRMAYEPNIYAVLWFAKNCWDRIHQAFPTAKFIVAGADATTEVINLGNARNIEIAGYVESMSAVISQADIAVVPMQSGSGMQNKILEAMACGVPVVTTTLGLGTIAAINGHSVMVADTVDEFVAAVITSIQDEYKRKEIGDNGRKLVESNHSLSSASTKIESIYKAIIGDR